jgi:NUMOD4 motif
MAEQQRTEKWVDVVGYEGLYSVSNRGKVRSEPRTTIQTRNGRQFRHRHKGRTLKPGTIKGGVRVVCLCRDNTAQMFSLAKLVMTHHGSPPPPGWRQVRHKDSDHSNNDIRNLYWFQKTRAIQPPSWLSREEMAFHAALVNAPVRTPSTILPGRSILDEMEAV